MVLASEPLAVLDLHHMPGPWMKRIEDPYLERRTPGIVTLLRPASARAGSLAPSATRLAATIVRSSITAFRACSRRSPLLGATAAMAACSKPSAVFNSSSLMTGDCPFSIHPNGVIFWRYSMIVMVAHQPSSPARSPSNFGTTSLVTPPSATRSSIASFTTLTAFNLPEKACEKRTPAIKNLTTPQTPEHNHNVGRTSRS
jgi:hypothetical protein